MIDSKAKRQFSRIRRGAYAALAGLLVLCTGCGSEVSGTTRPEDVDLLNPVGVAINYETVIRRDLYNTKVYSGVVCPYVEEYQLNESISFDSYDAFPGHEVKRGGALLHGNTDSYDERIENMEETIANMDESYQEFVEQNTEAQQQPLEEKKGYGGIVDNLAALEPEQFIVKIDPETGEKIETENPEYAEWEKQYKQYDGFFRSASQTLLELEQALKERTELYELDRAYNLLQMERLKEDKQKSILTAGMDGVVASMQFFYGGNWISSGQPLMAVGDLSRKEIRCEYVAKNVVSKAEDVYAIIDGKRYEVEYVPMEAEEYEQQMDRNKYVYGTFRLIDGADEVEIGSYVVIVVKSKSSQNVLAVPNDAVNREGYTNYVYVIEDGTSVYTPVTTGMTDGVYTEIVSGLEEGDHVLTENLMPEGTVNTVKVEYGEMHNTYSTMGYLYYPATELVRNPVEYGTCYYVESCVSLYQRVQKGEVLGRVRVTPDQLEIERNERKLQRERERLADLINQGEETHKKEIEAKEKTIKELEELLADMKADAALTEIKAPADGIITGEPNSGWPPMEEGSLLSPGEVLFVLADENKSYIYIEDPNHLLTYGNNAEVTISDGAYYMGNQLQIPEQNRENSVFGKVVTLNQMSLNSELVTDYSLVLVGADDMGKLMGVTQNAEGRWMRELYGVTVNFREMENVLVVPKSAVTLTAGATYVKVKLENGDVEYRSFVAGGSDSTNYWVVEGLTEGMEICIE